MSKTLYTVILDWDGGTYISQVEGNDINEAKLNWLKNFDTKILNTSDAQLKSFREDLIEENDVLLESLSNVWCFTSSIKEKLALINIVATQN